MDDSKSSADDGEINAGCGIKSSVTMKDAIAFMYSELMPGFNLFLPQAHAISVPLEDDAFAGEMEPFLEDALKFIKNVKEQLNAEQLAYFLNLQHEHQHMRKSFEDLYSEPMITQDEISHA